MDNPMYRLMSKLGLFFCLLAFSCVGSADVRVKEIARFKGVRDNALTGYGLVTGLAGTGDSSRSQATNQSLLNALAQFGVHLGEEELRSRNVAAVIVTATLPPFAEPGDKLDIGVSSIGDARSLAGGTLLLTPLKAANDTIYALAQGSITVGGFSFDSNGNLIQKNHPTVGIVSSGAIVERGVRSDFVDEDGELQVILFSPDFTTIQRLERAVNDAIGSDSASVVHAGKLAVKVPEQMTPIEAITAIEGISIKPDRVARVVINERTGTVVAGGDVRIDDVTISHGTLKVVISTDFLVSQPSFVIETGGGVRSVVVPDTQLDVTESVVQSVDLPSGTTIADLVAALRQIKTTTREVITILEAINRAGALHAQLIVQ